LGKFDPNLPTVFSLFLLCFFPFVHKQARRKKQKQKIEFGSFVVFSRGFCGTCCGFSQHVGKLCLFEEQLCGFFIVPPLCDIKRRPLVLVERINFGTCSEQPANLKEKKEELKRRPLKGEKDVGLTQATWPQYAAGLQGEGKRKKKKKKKRKKEKENANANLSKPISFPQFSHAGVFSLLPRDL